jgi:hypothetical protein
LLQEEKLTRLTKLTAVGLDSRVAKLQTGHIGNRSIGSKDNHLGCDLAVNSEVTTEISQRSDPRDFKRHAQLLFVSLNPDGPSPQSLGGFSSSRLARIGYMNSLDIFSCVLGQTILLGDYSHLTKKASVRSKPVAAKLATPQ